MDAVNDGAATLRRASIWLVFAHLLLVAAGLRHHLVWGESERWPWLLPLLHAAEATCLLLFVVLATVGLRRAARAVERDPPAPRRLLVTTCWIYSAALLVPPFLTADPVDYVVRGRLMAVHGANPYVQVATDFPGDPFLQFGDAAWKSMPLPYGPVTANLQAAIAWLAHQLALPPIGELIVALLLFKLVFAIALLASAFGLRRLAMRLAADASPSVQNAHGAVAFVLVAWNPLLTNECLANAHNEPLVLVCLVAAALAAVGGAFGSAAFALGVGAMVKVVPLLLAPAFAVFASRRRGLARLSLGVSATLLLAAGFWWQFFQDPAAFDVARRQAGLAGASVWWGVHRVSGFDVATLATIGRIGIVLAAAALCVRLWGRSEPRELVRTVAGSLLLLAVFGAPLFGVWYHVWWVPFALLLREGFLYRYAVAISVLAPVAWLPWAGLRRLDDLSQWWILAFGIAVPALLALLFRPRAAAWPRVAT